MATEFDAPQPARPDTSRSRPLAPVVSVWPRRRAPGWSPLILLGVATLHGTLAFSFLNAKTTPPAASQEATLIASLIQLETPKAEPEPPKPLPVEPPPEPKPEPKPVKKEKPKPKPKVKPKELITSTAEPLPEPAPAAPVVEARPPAPTPAPAAPVRGTPMADTPRTAPRFDAAYLNNPAPQYPPISRRLGEAGQVLLRVHVTPEGNPKEIQIHRSSGYDRLDATARAAVERWRFVPAKQGEYAIAAWVIVPINFTLRN